MALKRLPPSPLAKIRSGWKAGTAALVAALSLIGTLVTIVGAGGFRFGLPIITAALAISAVIAVVAAYIRGRGKLLPDSIIGETDDGHFRAHLCTSAGLHEACDLTRNPYGSAYVGDDIAEQWRLRNPYAFVQIMNAHNRLCACFGILALDDSFMDLFIAGDVSDQQLRGERVLGWPESKQATRLYLSGVVVLEPGSPQGHRRALVMFWAMLEYVRQLYGLDFARQLYAVAVTPESALFMKKHGFVVNTSGAQRKDKHDLYRFDLTQESWNTLLHDLNDWAYFCDLDFSVPVPGATRSIRSDAAAPNRQAIVFIAGDRGGTQRNQVQIPREFTSIQEAVRSSTYRDAFEIVSPVLGATRQALVEVYRHRPAILHFAGHGDERALSLILDQGVLVTQTNVAAEQLVSILGAFEERVQLCVLNTCDSAAIAERLSESGVVDAAIGWPAKVSDEAAIAFSRALYGALGDGLPLSRCVTLATQSSNTATPPRLHCRQGVDPDHACPAQRTNA